MPRPYTTASTRVCQFCDRVFNAKGHSNHERACKVAFENARRDRAFEERLALEALEMAREARRSRRARTNVEEQHNQRPDIPNNDNNNDDSERVGDEQSFTDSSASMEDEQENELEYEVDDIKVEYHPKSNRPPVIHHFHDYQRELSSVKIPSEEEPWRPFVCRADFEFARVALEGALNAAHINSLIKVIRSVASGAKFTLSSDKELSRIWDLSATQITPFVKKEIIVPYKKEERKYELWLRPLWNWTIDLLSEKRLAPHFVWDAQRLYKFNGLEFVRFYDEPWTAERFWNIQSSLPDKSRLFAWIIYADKNKLLSFGTEKGYPVIARCANLPSDIRNGNDIGGGRIIGWLPIVKEDSAHKGKLSYTNHKRAVWHAALREILKSIISKSKEGYWFRCADGKKRKIFPCILILSGDYEEQTFMTLIRGVNSLYPCPVCLIPSEEQADLSYKAPLRTQADTKALIELVQSETQAEAEKKLKEKGLRDLTNAFWEVNNSDPHAAVSWDRLHSYSTGVFGDHMWSDFKTLFRQLGRNAEEQIDRQFDMTPRFRHLHHFSEAVQIYFNDGSKFEALAKQLLFAAHNVLTSSKSPHGYKLLQCLRSFLTLDMILSFEVHTEDTIQLGKRELEIFSVLIAEYVAAIPPAAPKFKFTKNWKFIKMHYQQHAFDDILAKGATKNYNTKYNEKLHKPLRDAYHMRTNFKNVAGQILKTDHRVLISTLVSQKIQELDERLGSNQEEPRNLRNDETVVAQNLSHKYFVGAASKKRMIYEIEDSHPQDAAFKDFRKKLNEHLNDYFLAHAVPLPNGNNIRLAAHELVTEYKLLKVNYESMVTWKEVTDILRCNPKFHKRARYDFVIVRTVNGDIYARLICILGIHIAGEEHHVALVLPYDAPIGLPRRKDIDLGLKRVKAKPRVSSEFISLHTVIRGALLVPDYEKEGECLVMDVLDADMFLRVKKMDNPNFLAEYTL